MKNLVYDEKVGWIELRGTITIPLVIYETPQGINWFVALLMPPKEKESEEINV